MILFFGNPQQVIYAVHTLEPLSSENLKKLNWLFADAPQIEKAQIDGKFIGPRTSMISPWSTNAVEITQNMDIKGILRMEEFYAEKAYPNDFDPMISELFENLNQEIFNIGKKPEDVLYIKDIKAYNIQEGLALDEEEIKYLEDLTKK